MFATFEKVTLADHEDMILDPLEVNGERVIEASQLTEAAFAQVFGRGNRLTTITFGVSRQWEDYGKAEMRALRLNRDLPDQGTLSITTSDEMSTFEVPGAGLQNVKARAEGVMTFESYVFICGIDSAKT